MFYGINMCEVFTLPCENTTYPFIDRKNKATAYIRAGKHHKTPANRYTIWAPFCDKTGYKKNISNYGTKAIGCAI